MKLDDFCSFTGTLFDGTTKADQHKLRVPAGECRTKWETFVSGASSRAKAVIPFLYRLLLAMNGMGTRKISTAYSATMGYAEVKNDDGTMQVALCDVSSKADVSFAAASVSVMGTWEEYEGHQGTALLAAWLAWAYQNDSELKDAIDEIRPMLIEDPNDSKWDDAAGHDVIVNLALISSNVYYSFKGEYGLTSKQLERLRPERVKVLKLQKGANDTELFNPKPVSKVPVMGQYNLNPARTLTAEEKALIPQIGKNFKWEQWHMTVAQDIRDSQMFSEPYSVIMLGGPSGTGKSQGAAAIAYLLGRPRVIFTCDPDTDEFKLVGSTMPNTGDADYGDLPEFDDVEFDFEATYEKLFGKMPPKKDIDAEKMDCFKEIHNRKMARKETDFHFVKSEIVKALEYGWVVEVQEPTVIKRSSVLVALNALLDNDVNSAMITLPTGETIKRHKEAVVIYTTNNDYAGCQAIQQSVLSRIDSIREIGTPSVDVLCERTIGNTGWKDKKALKTMAKVVHGMNRYCHDKDITDGVCGTRELQSWAKKALMLQLREKGTIEKEMPVDFIIMAAFSTILSHVSQVDEDREDCITAEFKKVYGDSPVNTAREAYALGFC